MAAFKGLAKNRKMLHNQAPAVNFLATVDANTVLKHCLPRTLRNADSILEKCSVASLPDFGFGSYWPG